MGLFSDGHETYVATSAQQIVPADKFVPSTLSGAIKAIYNHGEVTEYVMEDLVNGIGLTAKAFYRKAQRIYPYGLPSSTGVSKIIGGAEVEKVLQEIYGPTVEVVDNYVGQWNYPFNAFQAMDITWNYDPVTGEVKGKTAEKGYKVTLSGTRYIALRIFSDTYATLTPEARDNPNYYVGWSLYPDMPPNTIIPMFPIQWDEPDPANPGFYITQTEYLEMANIYNLDFDPNNRYFHTTYRYNGETYYWIYKIGEGTHPTLDNIYNPAHSQNGTYFPWVYFRYDKIKGNFDPADEGYQAAKKMLKRIHMRYDDICDNIHENPDIGDVEQAILMWCVEADSQHPLEQRYLYEYFSAHFVENGGRLWTETHDSLLADSRKAADWLHDYAELIQDARFKMGLSNRGAYRRRFEGVIGPVNSYSSGQLSLPITYDETTHYEGEFGTQDVVNTITFNAPCHFYRKQINATQYEEIFLIGLSVRYYIQGNYSVSADGNTDQSRTDILLIPLDLAITQTFSLLDREELYTGSLHFIINSLVTVSVKWYESDFFQGVIFVVAAYLFVTGIGEGLVNFLAAAGTMTLEQILMAALYAGIEYVVDMLTLKLFIKIVGIKIAFLVAIIGMAYGMAGEMGTTYDIPALADMPYAGDLLKVSTGLAKELKTTMTNDLTGMKQEMDAMRQSMTDLSSQIKSIDQELAESSKLVPFIPLTVEAPEDFYNRTIHAGNIGIIGIDAVSNYVERSLTLPEPTYPGATV